MHNQLEILYSQQLSILKKIKATNPVILNITNFVTMDFIANGLLSLGASPIMSQAIEEIEALVQLSSCVVINIGTLNAPFLELANAACYFANKAQKPIILDPVGAGATTYRTNSARQLLNDHKIQIIRGNASEIAALINDANTTKGVDSTISMHDMQDEASKLAILFNATICVSGKTDLIVNTHNKALNQHGSPMMTRITGMGCLLTAVIGAFHAVEPDPFLATYNAALYYSLCGELAAQQASAPADFKRHFIDALYASFPLKYAVSISEER